VKQKNIFVILLFCEHETFKIFKFFKTLHQFSSPVVWDTVLSTLSWVSLPNYGFNLTAFDVNLKWIELDVSMWKVSFKPAGKFGAKQNPWNFFKISFLNILFTNLKKRGDNILILVYNYDT